jgi:hypothetical protein
MLIVSDASMPAASGAWHESSYADIVERLFREFEAELDLLRIESVISQCRHDLCGTPTAAQPELIERLARERLKGLIRPATDDET